MGQIGDQTTLWWGPMAGAGVGLAVSVPFWLSETYTSDHYQPSVRAGIITGTLSLLGATTGAVLTRRYDDTSKDSSQTRLRLSPPSLSLLPTREGYQTSLRLSGRF